MSKSTIAKSRPELEKQPVERQQDTCTHYWIIESPMGSYSHGTCKLCGAGKEFKNFVFYSPWEAQETSDAEGPSDSDGDVLKD